MFKSLLVFAILLFSSSTLAHHPLGGLPMETFAHGLLSGVGHPLLGFDHLFFVCAVGVAAALARRLYVTPLFYLASMLVACLATALWSSIAISEFMVAISLLVVGGMLLSGRAFNTLTLCAMFALFGLFHGAAFGETLAAQEASFGAQVLVGYLIGLGITQYLIALLCGTLVRRAQDFDNGTALQPRLAGAMVAGVGIFLVLEQLEGPLLSVLIS